MYRPFALIAADTAAVVVFADAEEVAEAAEKTVDESYAGGDATYNDDVASGMAGQYIEVVLLVVSAFHTAHRKIVAVDFSKTLPENKIKTNKINIHFSN